MKRILLAATLSLLLNLLFGGVHAAVIDLVPSQAGLGAHGAMSPAVGRIGAATVSASVSELPEPEVFAMMLVGLILIGYRARRDSSEKFK